MKTYVVRDAVILPKPLFTLAAIWRRIKEVDRVRRQSGEALSKTRGWPHAESGGQPHKASSR